MLIGPSTGISEDKDNFRNLDEANRVPSKHIPELTTVCSLPIFQGHPNAMETVLSVTVRPLSCRMRQDGGGMLRTLHLASLHLPCPPSEKNGTF